MPNELETSSPVPDAQPDDSVAPEASLADASQSAFLESLAAAKRVIDHHLSETPPPQS